MKKLISLFCLFFSLVSYAQSEVRYTSEEDFDILPLTTSNSQLIEGVWTGKSVVIEVESMQFARDNRIYAWVTISNTKTNEVRTALLYYHSKRDNYELYVFDLGISVPLEIMIFKYTDRVAFERKMKCSKGGYVMRLRFALDENESQAVQLQRETCSEQ